MKTTIRDRDVLQAIGPYQLAAYLRAGGWSKAGTTEGVKAIWTLAQDHEEYEVLVPLAPDLRDYALRMAEVLRTLEAVEDRSQLEVLRDIEAATADIVRIAAGGENTAEFSIPIEAGVRMVENARDLVLAAACAAVQPRQIFATRKPTLAVEYLRKVRLGQTERGSFVLNIESPVPVALQGQQRMDLGLGGDEPFERRVTQMLMRALAAVRNAAAESSARGTLDPFTAAVERGVSANLCDAIVGLHEGGAGRTLSVRMHWASARTPDPAFAQPSYVAFTRDVIPVLQEVSRQFKESGLREEFELQGVPVTLHSESAQAGGTVLVDAVVNGAVRRVRITLPSGEYELAIAAHKDEKTVSCSGELVREGRAFVLRNPRGFTIEQDEP